MQKLRVNDEIVVLTGRDKGKKGKIKKIFLKRDRILVDGINIAKKTVQPTQNNPGGGITEKEMSIHRSNVALVDPKEGKATKIHFKKVDDKKVRVATLSKTVLS